MDSTYKEWLSNTCKKGRQSHKMSPTCRHTHEYCFYIIIYYAVCP